MNRKVLQLFLKCHLLVQLAPKQIMATAKAEETQRRWSQNSAEEENPGSHAGKREGLRL